MTKGLIELVTYMSQLVPSFERASESMEKLLKIKVSGTQCQIISEEIGKEVFEKEKADAQRIYDNIEKEIPKVLPKKWILCILVDRSAVNTRVQDENGSTWKEMKLGLVFHDKNVIRKGEKIKIIAKKEYVSYFGSVEEFKKHVLRAAIEAGYGEIEEVIIIGDGAHWIGIIGKNIHNI